MVTSIGRQALLKNLYRKVAETGLSEPAEPRLVAEPLPTVPVTGKSPRLSPLLSESLSSNGGDETNKSFNLALIFLFLISGNSSATSRSKSSSSWRANRRRLSSIRSVLRRRRWMTGLVVGLLVGLPATAHWVAKSLNFWRVAITKNRKLLRKRKQIRWKREIWEWSERLETQRFTFVSLILLFFNSE